MALNETITFLQAVVADFQVVGQSYVGYVNSKQNLESMRQRCVQTLKEYYDAGVIHSYDAYIPTNTINSVQPLQRLIIGCKMFAKFGNFTFLVHVLPSGTTVYFDEDILRYVLTELKIGPNTAAQQPSDPAADYSRAMGILGP